MAIVFLLFIFFRHNRKVFFICLSTLIVGVTISFVQFDINKKTFTGIVSETKDNYFVFYDGLERYYVEQYDNQYEIGDILKIKGHKEKLDMVTLESEFDFQEYLNNKGIKYNLKTTNILPIFKNPIKLHKWRKDFLSRFNEEARSIIGAIMFSDNSTKGKTTELARSLHLTRLVSASGIFITFFINAINFIISYRLKEKHARLASLLILTPYLIFTFPRFCVIKIIFISLFKWLNDYKFKYKISYLGVISISGIFFLLVDRYLIYQDSFVLGFMIPIASYFINNHFFYLKKIPKKAITILFIFILFIPFEMKYFHEIAPLAYLYQIILSPLFLFLGLLGMISFIGIPIYGFINIYVSFLQIILKGFNYINPLIYTSTLNGFFTAVYYFLYISYFALKEFKITPLKNKTVIVMASLLIYFLSPLKYYIKEEVYFVNVGQGDCCLIHKGETTIMIDTGGNVKKDIAKNVLIPFLKKKQIYDLDLVITTHDDYDHMGALSSLIDNFKVQNYIKKQDAFPININGILIQNYNNKIDEDKNTSSLVMSFHLANRDFLITGDAPIAIEKEIMANYSNIPCDVLKVGHHGSNTSTCDEFIKYLSPKEAIISCGKNNSYGHPHSEVLYILKKNNVKIKRTDILGTITYTSYAFNI